MREMVPPLAVDGSAMTALPLLAARGAAHEVHLAADARVLQRSDGVRHHLAQEVHLPEPS